MAPLVEADEAFNAHVFVDLAREVGDAIVLGGAMGWGFSLYLGDEDTPRPPLATFLFAYLVVVTLGLVLLIQERFPSLGDGILALGMAVIVGNILGGPIILKQALSGAGNESSGDGSAGRGAGEG